MKYKVDITFTEIILGAIPKIKNIYDTYIKTRAKGKETKDEFESPMGKEGLSEKEAKGYTGFHEEKDKPYLFDYAVKGFFKEAAIILKNELGIKAARSKVDNYVFIFPRKIFISGKKLKEPIQRSLRVQTMQGPRVTLAKSDAIENGKISFEMEVLKIGPITDKHIKTILDYGRLKGLGQARNMGYGRFTYKLKKLKK